MPLNEMSILDLHMLTRPPPPQSYKSSPPRTSLSLSKTPHKECASRPTTPSLSTPHINKPRSQPANPSTLKHACQEALPIPRRAAMQPSCFAHHWKLPPLSHRLLRNSSLT